MTLVESCVFPTPPQAPGPIPQEAVSPHVYLTTAQESSLAQETHSEVTWASLPTLSPKCLALRVSQSASFVQPQDPKKSKAYKGQLQEGREDSAQKLQTLGNVVFCEKAQRYLVCLFI